MNDYAILHSVKPGEKGKTFKLLFGRVARGENRLEKSLELRRVVATARMAKLVRDDVVLKQARQHQQLVVERYIVSAVAAPPPPAVGPERYRAAVKRKAPRKFAHPCAKPSAEF